MQGVRTTHLLHPLQFLCGHLGPQFLFPLLFLFPRSSLFDDVHFANALLVPRRYKIPAKRTVASRFPSPLSAPFQAV